MASKDSSRNMLLLFAGTAILFSSGGMFIISGFYTYGIVLSCLGILVLVQLWRWYHQTNRSIAYFFDAVRNNDTIAAFPVSIKNKSLNMLYKSMNNLTRYFQNIRLEAEFREKYYKTIIKLSNTGLVVMRNDKTIELINEAACKLAGLNPLSTPNLLKIKNRRFYDTLTRLSPGEHYTFKNYNKYAIQVLLLKATEIKNRDTSLMLISIQDIRNELDEKEIESYHKLISTLTHEMMNSLAPLTSISRTLNNIFIHQGHRILPGEITDMEINTTIQGLKAIEEQSAGLTGFVANYRRLLKIPQPVLGEIDVHDWMEQLKILYKETCSIHNISLEIRVDEKIHSINGDKNLLNQVLVNLLNNAIDALTECDKDKRIRINVTKNSGSVLIQVGNNGPSIHKEILEKIFVPFFTTKETGSGIGLSISRQILKLHEGTLDVFSDEKTGTIFTLELIDKF